MDASAGFPLNTDLLFDTLVEEIRHRIIQKGLDEIILPPTSSEFTKSTLGITWKGTLILTNGKFLGLETIHRTGEARLSFSQSVLGGLQNFELTLTVDLGLTNPTLNYDFKLICMNHELDGIVTGTVPNLTFTIVLFVNLFTRKMTLVSFHFMEIGHIETEISGLGSVFNFLASKIASSMANRMKQEMATEVERQVEAILREEFEKISFPMDLPSS